MNSIGVRIRRSLSSFTSNGALVHSLRLSAVYNPAELPLNRTGRSSRRPSVLRTAFESDQKELRNMAASVFVAFGAQAVPLLLDMLRNNEDKWARKRIIHSLREIGAAAAPAMQNELYKEENPWYFLRNLIALLSDVADRKVVGKLTLLLFHAHPSVREETIGALTRLSPETAESHLQKALDDADNRVREKAVTCLGGLKSRSEKVLRYYLDVLEGKKELEQEAIRKARAKLREGDKQAALELLNRAIDEKPNLAQAHLEVAQLYDDYDHN